MAKQNRNFSTAEEASEIYKAKAKISHGEFFNQNTKKLI